jgi:RHS repeat-associated protein
MINGNICKRHIRMRTRKMHGPLFITALLLRASIGSAQPPTAYANGTTVSYVRTWDATAPEANASTLTTRVLQDVKQTTSYFDGLGRPLQTVIKEGSLETSTLAKKDMVSAAVYDNIGREQYKYLPFVSTGSDGSFKQNPFQQQATFMTAQYGTQGEIFFYSKTDFEASPLNRVSKTMAPGNSWAGAGRGTEAKYWFNTAADDIKKWAVTDVLNGWGTYTMTGAYPAGELNKTVIVDEHLKQVIEFKDKEGKVLLKKVQLTATADAGTGSGYTGWLSTYYIYDDLNSLRCVIQPKGVEVLSLNGWVIDYSPPTGGLVNEQLFRYEYDERNRMVMKKVPGAGEVWMVYDERDRMVMTQDANLRAQGKWMYTTYDVLNRPEATGLWTNSNDRVYHKGFASVSSAYPNLSGQTIEELTRTFYDDYNWLAANGNPFSQNRNTDADVHMLFASNTMYPYPQPVIQSFAVKGMVTGTKIKVLGSGQYLYGITYYDDKGRVLQTINNNITGALNITQTQYNFSGQPLRQWTLNMKTSTIRNDYILTAFDYDDLGRLISLKKTPWTYNNGTWTGGTQFETVRNEYDAMGQLKKKKAAPYYNSNTGLQTQTYDYNIRGWMLGVNRSEIAANGSAANYFGFELGYDKTSNAAGRTYTAAQFNGNISGIIWKSNGDGIRRKYDFSYDAANRLLQGLYEQNDGGATWGIAVMDYKIKMGDGTTATSAYDANGNIKAMTQYGWKMGANPATPIDNLTYNYIANSNKLLNVIDANNDPLTKLGDFRTSSISPNQTKTTATVDYTYDANGNLKKDLNKDIGMAALEDIVYNHLNLPQSITVRTTGGAVKGTITYTYDAAGNKLRKTVVENNATIPYNGTNYTTNITTTTTYLGISLDEAKTYSHASLAPLQYADRLQFISHEEGRIRFTPVNGSTPSKFSFDFFLKDHLGNIRMVLTDEIQQDIYPAATLENTNVTVNGVTSNAVITESQFYNIDNTKIVTQATATGIPVYQNNNSITNNNIYSNTAANSARLYLLNSATNTVANKNGLGIVLKVMAGDNLNIFGKSYHKKPTGNYIAATNPLAVIDLMNLFAGAPALSGKGITGTQITGQSGFPTSVTTLLNNQPAQTTTTPRASINWIILDEQFKYVSGGFDMVLTAVNSTGSFKSHTVTGIQIPKNGYIYVYCSNESQYNVFFDNLQVVHNRGPILEETHYNSWGMTLAGISSKSAGGITNKYKFTGKEEQRQEFVDGSGLEWTDFGARMYDNQIGRWHVIDLKSEKYVTFTPYNYSANNPIRYIDVDGKDFVDAKGNKMTYTLDKKGNMVWSSNTSADVKRLSKIMQMTTTSKESFNAMYNSDIKVHFSFSPKVDKVVKDNGDGTGSTIYHYGVTKKGNDTPPDYGQKQSANGTYGVTETNVTVFEGSIKEAQKLKIGVFANLTLDEAIATQVSHEKVHAVDKDQINGEMQKTYDKKPFDNEKKPTENEKKVIEELKKQKSN